MSELVGYQLIDQNKNVIQQWGGIYGYTPGVPNPVVLPNGDEVCAMSVDETVQGYTLVQWMMDAPAPDGASVDVERDRRRYLPISVTTSQAGTFQVNMDAVSQSNIQGLVSVGLYLQSANPTQTTVFRDLTNQEHQLLPSELISMGLQVAAYIQLIYEKSWALKAMSTVPADYTSDGYWK